MSQVYNRAYSAPRGYDLRCPYNVPMGEIQVLPVVQAFSTRSWQRGTIVEGFRGGPLSWMKTKLGSFGPPEPPSDDYIQTIAKGHPNNNQYGFQMVSGVKAPCSYRDVQLEKMYIKEMPRIK